MKWMIILLVLREWSWVGFVLIWKDPWSWRRGKWLPALPGRKRTYSCMEKMEFTELYKVPFSVFHFTVWFCQPPLGLLEGFIPVLSFFPSFDLWISEPTFCFSFSWFPSGSFLNSIQYLQLRQVSSVIFSLLVQTTSLLHTFFSKSFSSWVCPSLEKSNHKLGSWNSFRRTLKYPTCGLFWGRVTFLPTSPQLVW